MSRNADKRKIAEALRASRVDLNQLAPFLHALPNVAVEGGRRRYTTRQVLEAIAACVRQRLA